MAFVRSVIDNCVKKDDVKTRLGQVEFEFIQMHEN